MPRTKPPSDTRLTIRIPKIYLEKLEAHCLQHGKTKTQVVLEFIEKLKV